MRKTKFFIVFPILFLLTLACNALVFNSPATVPTPSIITTPTIIPTPTAGDHVPLTEAEVPRISLEQARAAIESGAAIVVDVRSSDNFNLSHIPGALNIQLGEFETNITGLDLDKEQWIITYCT